MWTLGLIFWFKAGYAGGMAATTGENFSSQVTCEAAGKAAVENLDTFHSVTIKESGLINKTQSFEKGSYYHDSIDKAYQCIMVK